jgi:AI-2E family transporter
MSAPAVPVSITAHSTVEGEHPVPPAATPLAAAASTRIPVTLAAWRSAFWQRSQRSSRFRGRRALSCRCFSASSFPTRSIRSSPGNAGAWAVVAGLLHIVPYLGPGVTAVAMGMAAFMQFDSFAMALMVAGASLAIATVVGTFVTIWMTGRIANMNSAAVFISLLFWGWLWGVWGMLLSIPLVVIVKVVSQHVEQLSPTAELLGD